MIIRRATRITPSPSITYTRALSLEKTTIVFPAPWFSPKKKFVSILWLHKKKKKEPMGSTQDKKKPWWNKYMVCYLLVTKYLALL